MFEEICLVCSKHTDGRPYCSSDCQSEDLSSPSVSSSSSALSSPSIAYAPGGDVPALALGSALKMYAYASSASSTLTDDDDDDAPSFLYSALSYARRPSGTNNHSTVPRLQHRRLSSGSSAGLFPRSAPVACRPPPEDDLSFDDDRRSECSPARSRARASLPACFSLLKMASPAHTASSSSGHTAARPSPPTPLLPLAARPASIPLRGRAEEPDDDFPRRGRAATRRNSSPPPHPSSERPTRGRARVEELGAPMSPDAPGYGAGRSGLLHRERTGGRVAL
ncbi:hypothetical protein HYPSUDRAFT_198360 [Hypholoma sublateritium FD-334 SS-4]|uniref:Uncharacterized protein n=1 Tax=Hypholoma sublateritium (strain FD-334 SS-4) TaxID=945553 RepID=A0A0D2Q642_HYPSF|nr:hypothetical protein HYPSUDRAFT_198360 [Hypholoma sublateritium FD-334 SS-4]